MSGNDVLHDARSALIPSIDAAIPDAMLAVVAGIPRWKNGDPLSAIVNRMAAAASEALDDDELAAILLLLRNRTPRADGFHFVDQETIADYARHMAKCWLTSAAREHLDKRLAEFT